MTRNVNAPFYACGILWYSFWYMSCGMMEATMTRYVVRESETVKEGGKI